MHARFRIAPALVAGALTLAACGGGNAGTDSVATVPTTDSAAGTMALPSDSAALGGAAAALAPANIASLVGLTNASEIGAAQVARDKATDADVRAFARMMIDEHQAMQKQLDSLATGKNIVPEAPPQAEQMRQQESQLMSTLNSTAKGAAFDRAYMDSQVQAHQKALSDLQSFAGTNDAELRTLLEQAIPKVQAHLERAQQIQSKLGAAGS